MPALKNVRTPAPLSSTPISFELIIWLREAFMVGALLLLFCIKATGTTYYVDAQNGNDGYNGLAPAHQSGPAGPWRTVSKVNQISFSPGDSILFKRGGLWLDGPLEPLNGGASGGTITITETVVGQPLSFDLVDPNNNNCVYFGAYGTSPDKPRIDCQGGRGIILAHNYIIVEDLHLDNGGNNVLWFNRSDGINWINVKNVDVTHSSSNAVRFSEGGGNIWLKGVYVYDYGINGILLNGSPNNQLKHVLVEDCWVENPQTLDLEDAITCHQHDNTYDLEGYIIIRNNTIRRAGEDGIDVTSGTHILLDGNDIRHSFSAGILLSKPWVNTIEVRNNFIYSNSFDQGNGDLSIRVPNVWAYNNVIAGDGHNCLSLSDTDNTKIWNNIIAPMNRTGNFIRFTENVGSVELNNNIFDFSLTDQEIHIETPNNNIVFDYNCYFGTSSSQDVYDNQSFQQNKNTNPLFEPNGFWGDPEFVSTNRTAPDFFQLEATSPCIDAGVTLPVSTDFWGTARPQGAQMDIGIFELATNDCNPDPNITASPGSSCDDGDPTTINDIYDTNCNCAGEPGPCTNIGDADGDGVCADVDCDDNDADITYQPGDACDDGDPNTVNDIILANCSCAGDNSAPISTCSQISSSSDDAEEWESGSIDLSSSDLEMAEDPRRDGNQTVGMRFNGLNIPQGATILNAFVQFTVDETINLNPCELTITGQASDNAPTFQEQDYNISSRPRTTASVNWSPQDWAAAGNAGPEEQSPGLSSVIQEIVDRNGYSSGNSIVIIIEGMGRRTAEAYDGSPNKAAELCVEYQIAAPAYDCPGLNANIGDSCNDGDNTTNNDTINSNCNCTGTPTACTGIGDADGDGICADVDCNDNDASATSQLGDACDDGDNTTVNDTIDSDCNCTGTPTACTGVGDNDGDGVCADVDCNDNDPNITAQPGDACNDGNPNTSGEFIQTDCSCGGGVYNTPTITSCSRVNSESDDAEERSSNQMDLTSSDLELINDQNLGDQRVGMRFRGLDIPQGATITNAFIQFTADEDNNVNPCNLSIFGQNSNNAPTFNSNQENISNRPKTTASVTWAPPTWQTIGDATTAQQTPDISSIIQEVVNRAGYSASSSIVIIIEGSGRRVAESFDGASEKAPELCVEYHVGPPSYDCPSLSANIGDACNDGDNTTTNDTVDNDCNCAGTPSACTGIGDADGDGVCANVDCNDNNPSITYQPGDACNDGDNTTANDTVDNDCNCAGTPTACTGIGDADGDGVCANVDCNDNDPGITYQPGDACNDGDNTTANDTIDSNCNCTGTPTTCTGIGDADGDGVCADVDCNDNDAGITYKPGDACNDGDNTTANDTIDSNCNCTGTPTACTGIGDADGDGVCADVDCNDNDASATSQIGDACDDGDNTTVNDAIDNNCDCTGTPTACTGIGDMDGDGVCGDVDCDDDDPNNTSQLGDACDDGDPNTAGETIQNDCSCGGGANNVIITSCSSVNSSNNDAEEWASGQVDLSSSDLELTEDPTEGNQVTGMRFNGLGIPQGVTIVNAYIQFTVDEARDEDPCNLSIFGQDSDNAEAFTNNNYDLTNRPRTTATASWTPQSWPSVGASAAAQQTADISSIIQEVVNRPGYTANSSFVLLIEGIGRRTAESYDGSPEDAPELCIEYNSVPPTYDCPSLNSNIGDPCDDGDPNTEGETIQSNCSCGGGNPVPYQSCSRIDDKNDDAEERPNGDVKRGDKELEISEDPDHGNQLIGLRFNGLNIPQGAQITYASVQFTVEDTDNDSPCNLSIHGEASDDADRFEGSDHNISDRPFTNATVGWSPPEWTSPEDDGPDQQTPDISAIIQEIVNRSGYDSGSSIVLIIDGTGRRIAKSYNESETQAPELCIEYFVGANATSNRAGQPGVVTSQESTPEAVDNLLSENNALEESLPSALSPISIYPNPAKDQLTLSFNSAVEGSAWIQARSINGQLMLTEKRTISQGENKLSLEGLSLPSGLYLLQLSSENGEAVQATRFIIARE